MTQVSHHIVIVGMGRSVLTPSCLPSSTTSMLILQMLSTSFLSLSAMLMGFTTFSIYGHLIRRSSEASPLPLSVVFRISSPQLSSLLLLHTRENPLLTSKFIDWSRKVFIDLFVVRRNVSNSLQVQNTFPTPTPSA